MNARDSSDPLPEQVVGAALRTARLASGLSLREMARRLNYGSHSALSEYEHGARMPSETVVGGYERVLGLPSGALYTILETANIERHGDAWSKRRSYLRSAPQPPAGIPSTAEAAASPWPWMPVADGADPDQAGCSEDAITIHSRRIALIDERSIVGQIELRFSPSKNAAWGRFKGYSQLDHLATRQNALDIVVEIARRSDGSCVSYRQTYAFDLHWGDLLVADEGVFQARATVVTGTKALACGQTDWRGLYAM
jgi:transcriptional regulator with XRE-family HTH domain